jgi:hypothetical protein
VFGQDRREHAVDDVAIFSSRRTRCVGWPTTPDQTLSLAASHPDVFRATLSRDVQSPVFRLPTFTFRALREPTSQPITSEARESNFHVAGEPRYGLVRFSRKVAAVRRSNEFRSLNLKPEGTENHCHLNPRRFSLRYQDALVARTKLRAPFAATISRVALHCPEDKECRFYQQMYISIPG